MTNDAQDICGSCQTKSFEWTEKDDKLKSVFSKVFLSSKLMWQDCNPVRGNSI